MGEVVFLPLRLASNAGTLLLGYITQMAGLEHNTIFTQSFNYIDQFLVVTAEFQEVFKSLFGALKCTRNAVAIRPQYWTFVHYVFRSCICLFAELTGW